MIIQKLINNDPLSKYNNLSKNRLRATSCDKNYLKQQKDLELSLPKLDIVPDAKHIKFLGKKHICTRCHEAWIPMVGKYACLLSSSLFGSKNDINYILINILHDMTSNTISDENPLKKNIIAILKNINCRSDLTKVIQERINEIKSKTK